MIVLRDEVSPEGASRGTPSALLRPLSPVVRVPVAPDGGGRLAGSSIFANQGYFYAQCRAEDAVGSCVYANSTEAFVSTADEASPQPVIGIIVAKQSDTNCTVQRYGQSMVEFTGLIPGKRYFLGPAGSIITPPFDADMPEYVQQVGNAISSTELFVQPTGQVIRRIVSRDFVLNTGTGDPQANGVYDHTDVFIDKAGLRAFFSPTMEGENSVILVGDGDPTEDAVRDAQAVYRDAEGNLYFADGSGSPSGDVSALIFGEAPPTGAELPQSNVFYLEQDQALDAYARTQVTGVS